VVNLVRIIIIMLLYFAKAEAAENPKPAKVVRWKVASYDVM
jgi:hypothetical protein